MSVAATSSSGKPVPNRWVMLLAGVVAMMTIANLQYAWAVFVNPMAAAHPDWTLAAIQGVFAVFILVETWLVPFEAYLVDRFGPRVIVSIGAVLIGASWVGCGLAGTLELLYASYVIGGIGAGCVYGSSIGMANKWFPDRRGLAAGMTAAGYGAGAAFTVAPIQAMIDSSGYQQAFIVFGVLQGVVCLITAQFTALPPRDWLPPGWDPALAAGKRRVRQSLRQVSPLGMVKTSHFWLLYAMFVMAAPGGLIATASLGPMAKSYGIEKETVMLGMTVMVVAVQLTRLLNGVARIFWGWLSDHIGRENCMAMAFTLEAIGLVLWMLTASNATLFVLMSGLVFFAWGCIFSLFPASTGDLFGTKYATTNYGIMYTAKGVASIFAAPLAAALFMATQSWDLVLLLSAAASLLTAILALFVLKPLTSRYVKVVEMPKPAG